MDSRIMTRAIALAVENARSGRGGPFAAIVVKDGAVIAEGVNQVTSSSDPTAHAEVVAIREACRKLADFQLTGCEVYASCEPCPMCLGALYWARPARVYYAATSGDAAAAGFDDSAIYREFSAPRDGRSIPFLHTPVDGFDRPFREWAAKPDKTEY